MVVCLLHLPEIYFAEKNERGKTEFFFKHYLRKGSRRVLLKKKTKESTEEVVFKGLEKLNQIAFVDNNDKISHIWKVQQNVETSIWKVQQNVENLHLEGSTKS